MTGSMLSGRVQVDTYIDSLPEQSDIKSIRSLSAQARIRLQIYDFFGISTMTTMIII